MINKQITKKILSNGLTILVYPVHTIPKVSTQLWYGVGSKDEKDGQRGLAHFLEHMIFKGTEKLSESDINIITHRLSGYCNAFTSHDYTGYLFDLPKQHYDVAFELLADCMFNCTFKTDLLHAEVKAVIQELKMYRDDYVATLQEQLVGAIFKTHPYHYPIIGFKQDLWTISRENLLEFYKMHYLPNNATLVVVGDVDAHDAMSQAEKIFGHLAADSSYQKQTYFIRRDLIAQSVTLYRDIQQPQLVYAFLVPGVKDKKDYFIELAQVIFANGRGSRLWKKLVDESGYASDIESTHYDLFDASIQFFQITPRDLRFADEIEKVIKHELNEIIDHGLSDNELKRAMAQIEMNYLGTFDNTSKIAYAMAKGYVATADSQALFDYIPKLDVQSIKNQTYAIFKNYFSPTFMHKGKLLPLSESEQKQWLSHLYIRKRF